jgi:putative membrane protein
MLGTIVAQLARGFCMGAADIVPGVSGGTVALVFGIYERLVNAVHEGAKALGELVTLDFRSAMARLREIDWLFLLPLLGGIGIAVLTLAHLIETLLEEQPVKTAAVFLGLVAASIVVAWHHLARRDPARMLVLVAAAVVTFLVLGIRSSDAQDPSLVFVFGAAAIAICAMILPGISGSFLLLMLGMYDYVLGAVNDRDLAVIVVFAVGAVLGLALFSSLLNWLLEHHHDTVIAGLIGLMAGSLRVLWPWPEGTENARLAGPPSGEWLVPLLLAVGAAAVVIVVARLAEPERDQDIRAAQTS